MSLRSTTRRLAALLLALLLLAACEGLPDLVGGDRGEDDGDETTGDLGDPGDCVTVDMAVSPEKIDLLTDLARIFNDSDEASLDDRCVFVRPYSKSSGAAMTLLSEGWPEPDVDGPAPVIW